MTLTTSDKQTSIIDILSESFAVLNRSPWIVIIPLIFNFYLWFVPGVSLAPILEQTAQLMRELPTDSSTDMVDIRDQSLGLLEQLARDDMRPQLAWLNTIPYSVYTLRAAGASAEALGLPFVVALPASVADSDVTTSVLGNLAVTSISDGGDLISVWLWLNVGTLLLSALFLETARDGIMRTTAPHTLWRRALRTAGRLALYAFIIVGAVTLVLIPVSLFTFVLININPVFGAFLIFIGSGIWLWVGVYLGFTREIMVIEQVGPIAGIRTSVRIVRTAFWRTLALLSLLLVIVSGLGIIFTPLLASPWGRVGTVIISAYLMSGLVLARMRFVKQLVNVDGSVNSSSN